MTKDEKFIARCIELATQSVKRGEAPFGALVVMGNKIIAESGNRVIEKKDVTQHAEMRVILQTQKKFNSFNLSKCTLYTNCEPCPLCSFMVRELKFRRVVYSLKSPYMGGHSKWNILEDRGLEKFRPVFCKPPRVVSGILREKAKEVFRKAGWRAMFVKK